ncbi:hypothetical protein [Streptomyces hirsutus]|uniref:hypothetical protein n=1 Tax=Streptomyces hirsutus TaxID=35620 RepID=UPI00368F7092
MNRLVSAETNRTAWMDSWSHPYDSDIDETAKPITSSIVTVTSAVSVVEPAEPHNDAGTDTAGIGLKA